MNLSRFGTWPVQRWNTFIVTIADLLLIFFKKTLVRNINLRVFGELELITKMLMLSILFSQSCIWQGSWCYMLHFIFLNMAFMIWCYGYFPSNINLGCITRYQVRYQDSPEWVAHQDSLWSLWCSQNSCWGMSYHCARPQAESFEMEWMCQFLGLYDEYLPLVADVRNIRIGYINS